MKIGIIGVGNIGGSLARTLSKDHQVSVANSRGPEAVRDFAEGIGATPTDAHGTLEGADLVILSIPLPAVASLGGDLFADLPAGVPVVDTGNYYPGMRDPRIPALDEGQPDSEWVAQQVGRPVIKAFNNILAESLDELGRPSGDAGRLAITVAGDDDSAKAAVMDLVDHVGFDPVDGGTLAESWRQQPASPGYCCDYDAETLRRGLTLAVREEIPVKRDAMSQKWMSLDHALTHAELVAGNREAYGVS